MTLPDVKERITARGYDLKIERNLANDTTLTNTRGLADDFL